MAYPHLVNPYRIIVLEDCATYLMYDRTIEELAAMARHLKLSVYVITQHPQKLMPICRSNADIVGVFQLHSAGAIETLAKDYLPELHMDDAKAVLSSFCWQDKNKVSQALMIDNRDGNTLQERMYTIVAPDPGPFHIGCAEYWRREQSLPDWDELRKLDEQIRNGNGYHGLTTEFVSEASDRPYFERPVVAGKVEKEKKHKKFADGIEIQGDSITFKKSASDQAQAQELKAHSNSNSSGKERGKGSGKEQTR